LILGIGESPPEPAPNAQQSSAGLGQRRSGRARLGYLESECESEPPYLPTMLDDPLLPYNSRGMNFFIFFLIELALCQPNRCFISLIN